MRDAPWELRETHQASGRQIFARHNSFTHTGNNEGTMSKDIEVRDAEGTVLVSSWMEIDWEYFGQINARFEDDGETLVVSGSDGSSERIPIPD
ncbi:hypothetical protein [Parerythrobacter aestuarii]|uniref:hypothetical protein n=1 Tax=Parerythrobacter aestuarii TaxID=3020909 RepID=UPI0024DE4FE0|nr:hypothetical protein [Parerythrobacter aestuarii]